MASLEMYPPVSLYVAHRMNYLPKKAHPEDFAMALDVDEASFMEYAYDHALVGPCHVIRSCDLQLSLTDDIAEEVARLEETRTKMHTMIERLAHAYRMGMPAHIYLG